VLRAALPIPRYPDIVRVFGGIGRHKADIESERRSVDSRHTIRPIRFDGYLLGRFSPASIPKTLVHEF
jgi:hypothetical protein